MVSMLTLLPALMVAFPRGVFWPYRPVYGSAEPTYRGMWARVGWTIAPRPRRVWVTTAGEVWILQGLNALTIYPKVRHTISRAFAPAS